MQIQHEKIFAILLCQVRRLKYRYRNYRNIHINYFNATINVYLISLPVYYIYVYAHVLRMNGNNELILNVHSALTEAYISLRYTKLADFILYPCELFEKLVTCFFVQTDKHFTLQMIK